MRGDAYHAGPVMLSDVYTSAVGSAKDGVAASQKALYNAYNSLNSRVEKKFPYFYRYSEQTNLDNFTQEGIYTRIGTVTNSPSDSQSHAMLINVSSVGTPFQLYFIDNSNIFYKRWKSSGVWTEWYVYNGVPLSKNSLAQFVRQRYSKTGVSVGTSNVNFSISGTKSGYTSIMYSLFYSYASTITAGVQIVSYGNGSFSCSGYAKRADGTSSAVTVTFYVDVLWMRN